MHNSDRTRVLFITESLGTDLFGVSTAILQLANGIDQAINWHIGTGVIGNIPDRLQPFISKLPFGHPWMTRWTHTQSAELENLIENFDPDIVHIHGVFMSLQRTAVGLANKRKIPTLLSTHGMLESWMWQQKGPVYQMAKRLFWRSIQFPVLRSVGLVHAITTGEAQTLRREFPGTPQVIIPNTIDLNEPGHYSETPCQPEPFFLFLSRMHPKKGAGLLIDAFIKSGIGSSYKLIIAGPEQDPAYVASLKAHVRQAGYGAKISFIGPLYGEEKFKLIAHAWALVLPSYTEVMGMVNLEAAAVYTPSVTTYQTGLLDWQEGGGLLVNPNTLELTHALQEAARWTPEERMARGRRSRALVAQRYNCLEAGRVWVDTYKSLV